MLSQPPGGVRALERLNVSETRPIAVELLNERPRGALGERRGLPTGQVNLAVGYEENGPTVSWQLDRLKSELRDADFTIVDEGETTSGLWASLIEFQALAIGQLSFVANVRPSSVESFMAELDPGIWAAQAHAGSGISSESARPGRIELDGSFRIDRGVEEGGCF